MESGLWSSGYAAIAFGWVVEFSSEIRIGSA